VFAACSTVHINIFGLHSIVKHGSEKQKQEWLPRVISGELRACFGVTEPDAGLDTSKIKTRAVRIGDHYVVTARRSGPARRSRPTRSCCWRAPRPSRILREAHRRPDAVLCRHGPKRVDRHRDPKMGRHAVNSNQTFFDGLECRWNTASARKVRAFATSSTA
jgi:acyl-CoA dehydrogenase